jgi:hypothetical protein
MRSWAFLFILLFFASCSQNKELEATNAIDVALTHLSNEDCGKAIEVLERVKDQTGNAVYVQVLASAYACRANFVATKFIADDVPKLNSSSLFKALATLRLSAETEADSSTYKDLRYALDLLVATDGQANREARFGVRKAGDMGVEIIMLSLVQLGKFLRYYGDADANGVKGAGPGTNTCFMNYTGDAALLITSSSAGGNCTTANGGHAELSITSPNEARGQRRLCEGLMLLTNALDVLFNIDLSNIDSLSSLEDAATKIQEFKDDALAIEPDLETLLTTTSQTACETLLADPTEQGHMQLIYAALFESGLQ